MGLPGSVVPAGPSTRSDSPASPPRPGDGLASGVLLLAKKMPLASLCNRRVVNGHPQIVRPSSVRACTRPAVALAASQQLPRRRRFTVAGVPTSSGRTVGAVPPAVPDCASTHRAKAHSRGHCPSARAETSRTRTPRVAATARGKSRHRDDHQDPVHTRRTNATAAEARGAFHRRSRAIHPAQCVRPTSRANSRRKPEGPLPKLPTHPHPRLPEDDRDRFPSHADRVRFPDREVHARHRTPTRASRRLLPTDDLQARHRRSLASARSANERVTLRAVWLRRARPADSPQLRGRRAEWLGDSPRCVRTLAGFTPTCDAPSTPRHRPVSRVPGLDSAKRPYGNRSPGSHLERTGLAHHACARLALGPPPRSTHERRPRRLHPGCLPATRPLETLPSREAAPPDGLHHREPCRRVTADHWPTPL